MLTDTTYEHHLWTPLIDTPDGHNLWTPLIDITYRHLMYIREYQDSDFFPDQLQTFIQWNIGPQRFQM